MKKKLLSTTYLNEAEEYKIKFYLNEKDKYVVAKKLDKISEPFIIGNGIIAMDNGYYILEIVPKNKKYALRIFFDDKKKIVEYYFDIIKESGVDEKTKIPYFIDAYLDIAISSTGNIKILDRDELDEALENGNATVICGSIKSYNSSYFFLTFCIFSTFSNFGKIKISLLPLFM